MAYRIFVRSNNTATWEAYGDCASWAEVRREINGHIRFLGLYSKVEKVGGHQARAA